MSNFNDNEWPSYNELVRRVEALEAWRDDVTLPGGCMDDPAPVPQWRSLVDERRPGGTLVYPLAVVLRELAFIHESANNRPLALARIVAVCEAQVGDGWQADPDLIRMMHKDGRKVCTIECLIDALALDDPSRWRALAGRAASWLKSITEGVS